ncbi:MAG: PKD domain-containing protein, partial [Bacteroidetes bacterium]|nr:PKD domain-containing protein [Bacteroidota bacterium]
RIPSGLDNNIPQDWQEFEQPFVKAYDYHNPLQVYPSDGLLIDTVSTFQWRAVNGASDYLIEIDDDSTFSSPIVSETVSGTSYNYAPGNGTWYWRITPNGFGGVNLPRSLRSFTRFENLYIEAARSPVPQRYQHKDTKLLCIWDEGSSKRGGCTEAAGANGPWDGSHPEGDHIPGCGHCSKYCTRASIQMINHRYGGRLSQDEISHRLKVNEHPGPEGDLGHNEGAWPEANNAYSWAMGGAAINQTNQAAAGANIPWNTYKAEIDGKRPVLAVIRPPGWFHTVVFTGYLETLGRRFIEITDPWPGRTGWYDQSRMPVVRFYRLPAGQIRGRRPDRDVQRDQDGDGVMNFDEKKRFCSVHNDSDTDDDEVKDKKDIRSYTFHDTDHGHNNDALNFPDLDGDGKRAECDCDSDNDGDFDGGEDVDGDGITIEAGDTDVYDPASNHLFITTDKPVYLVGEPVFLDGGTFHAISRYGYDIIPDCPPLAHLSPLAHDGIVTTNGAGNINTHFLGRFGPGVYKVVVDVKNDHTYRTPSCHDPETCFIVLAPPPCLDTVRYTEAKTLNLQPINTTSGMGFGQWFPAPQDISVSGFEFFGGVIDFTVPFVNLQCELFLAGPDSLPQGPPLASKMISVPNGGIITQSKIPVVFDSAITVNQPYIISVTNFDPNQVLLFANNWMAGDGQGEWLASVFNNGVWQRSYQANVNGFPFNGDMMFLPYVGYELTSAFQTEIPIVCATDVVDFFNASSPILESRFYNIAVFDGLPDHSYLWDFGDNSPPINIQNGSHAYASEGTYYVSLFDTLHSWSGIPWGVQSEFPVTVNSISGLNSAFTYQSDSFHVAFTDMTEGETKNWLWDFGDGTTSTDQYPVHEYSASGSYNVCMMVSDSCNTTTHCEMVEVNCSKPIIDAEYIASGLTAFFQSYASGGEFLQVNWDFGDGNSSGQPNPTHTYASPGEYNVCLTVSDECNSEMTCLTVVVDSIPETNTNIHSELFKGRVEVFPNPVVSDFSVRIIPDGPAPLKIRVMNLMGATIEYFEGGIITDMYQTRIDMSGYAQGIYLVEVSLGSGRTVKKVVKR